MLANSVSVPKSPVVKVYATPLARLLALPVGKFAWFTGVNPVLSRMVAAWQESVVTMRAKKLGKGRMACANSYPRRIENFDGEMVVG
jgi:hypothetical protein